MRWMFLKCLIPWLLAANLFAENATTVDDAIPAVVRALPQPKVQDFPNGLQMAITAKNEAAQNAVLQGINHLHGGWEMEATRHFAHALKEDPNCLMAYWGIIMSTLTPSPETGPTRNIATERMLDLVDQGIGSELERGLCYALIKYIQEGPQAAANAFRKVARDSPNDLQAPIFICLFSRSGYDIIGSPTPDQQAAEEILTKLLEKNPDHPVLLNALLTIRAEAPDLSASLPLARKLVQLVPNYPPYFHLLGHYEWRCGNHGKAASAFGKAASAFEKWMQQNNATSADCPEWVRSECYRITALNSMGDAANALAAANKLAKLPLVEGRTSSAGMRLMLWEATTLPARIYLSQSEPDSIKKAIASLAPPATLKPTHAHSLAYWWIDGLRLVLEGRRLIDEGKLEETQHVLAAIAQHGEAMSRTQNAAAESGERSSWTRAFRALEVYASELRGLAAMAGPQSGIGSAYNWFSSAADRQQPASVLMPPMVLYPMAGRIGEYFTKIGKADDATDAYLRALEMEPNHERILQALKKIYLSAGKEEDAKRIDEQIKHLADD